MPHMQRLLQAGASFAYNLSDLADVRARYTIGGAPTVVDSAYGGKSLYLDGTNDYVTLGPQEEHNLRFNAGTADFSIAAWVWPLGPTVLGGVIFGKEDGVNDGYHLWASGGGRVYLVFNAQDTFTDQYALDGERWQCIVATVDRSDVATIYIDGVDMTTTQPALAGAAMATTSVPTIGCRSYDNAVKWYGGIQAVSIWPRVLSQAEAAQLSGVV